MCLRLYPGYLILSRWEQEQTSEIHSASLRFLCTPVKQYPTSSLEFLIWCLALLYVTRMLQDQEGTGRTKSIQYVIKKIHSAKNLIKEPAKQLEIGNAIKDVSCVSRFARRHVSKMHETPFGFDLFVRVLNNHVFRRVYAGHLKKWR